MSFLGDAIILDWLAFNKVEFNGRRFELVSPGSEYWRYVTPALIHFGLIHILFNGLWIWEFGSRLELRLGSIFTLNLFLAGSIAGNLLQSWWSGPSIFGGLSGVVYGLHGVPLGDVAVATRVGAHRCARGFHLHVDLAIHRFHRDSKNTRVGVDCEWCPSGRFTGGYRDRRHYHPTVSKARLRRCLRIMKKR